MRSGLSIASLALVGGVSGGGGGGGFSMPANLAIAFEADQLSGLSNGSASGTIADPFNIANSWTGSGTKETFRGLPVLHVPAGSVVSSNSVFDASFNTAFTAIYVALCDAEGSNQTILSTGGIFGGVALTEQSSGGRLSQWFGKTGSNSARFNVGQVAAYRYDGAHVTMNRNKFVGDAEAYSSALGLSGGLDIGATSFSGSLKMRAAYVFNRALTDVEVESVVDYAAAASAGFAGNNSYLFVGDSMAGTAGGSVAWYSQVGGLLDSHTVDYNYIWVDATSGWTLEQMEAGIPANFDAHLSVVSTSLYETAIIRGGTNNIGLGATASETIAALDSLMTALTAAGVNRFVLVGCLPNATDDATKTAYRATYNAHMASKVTASVKFAAVQDAPELSDPTDTTYYADGLHETDAGKAISAQIVYDAIATF